MPQFFKIIERAGIFRHQMDNDVAEVNEIPVVSV
jgi:hypothetical protein